MCSRHKKWVKDASGDDTRLHWLSVCAFCLLLTCSCSVLAQPALTAGQNLVPLRGQTQRLYYLPAVASTAHPHKILFAPGDGGWRGFAILIAQQLAAQGNDVFALDTKRYLSSFTHKDEHLSPEQVMRDFHELAARITANEKITLIGWSTGAGLTVLAAANGDKSAYDGLIAISLGKTNILGWRCWDNLTYLTGKPPHEATFQTQTYLRQVAPLPLLVIQSSNDQFIPNQEAEELFIQTRHPKRFRLVHARNHSFDGNRADFFAALQHGLQWIEHRHHRTPFSLDGGEGMPLLPALGEATKLVTGPIRGGSDISVNNATTTARVGSVKLASQASNENYESAAQGRESAANRYAEQATRLTSQQAAANNAAARVQRDASAGGVEAGYRQQVQGVSQGYQTALQSNQVNLQGALQAAQILQATGMKAVKLEQMSALVQTLSRDLARRSEAALTLRY